MHRWLRAHQADARQRLHARSSVDGTVVGLSHHGSQPGRSAGSPGQPAVAQITERSALRARVSPAPGRLLGRSVPRYASVLAAEERLDGRQQQCMIRENPGGYNNGPSTPIISRRMIFTGTSPAARNRSWNSVSENFAPIFFL